MKLIVALGNTGDRYAQTRHNAGWLLADHLATQWGFGAFQPQKKFLCSAARGAVAGQAVMVVKPTTFMNRSGQCVNALRAFYRLDASDILVLHDDLDLPLGTLRWKEKGGHGGHNGIRSMLAELGTDAFSRLKLGIDSPARQNMPTDAFVLAKFPLAEHVALEKLFPAATQKILASGFFSG